MPKSLTKTIILIALMTLVSACGPAATVPFIPTPTPLTATAIPLALTPTPLPPTPTAAVPAPTSKTSAQGFLLEGVGFRTPESVLYDPKADLYLVANIHGDPSARDGNGFISRISPEGEVIALEWIAGQADGVTLNAPKGMALTGERLFVADIDVVRVFDRENGAPLDEIAVQGARFLNDVAADEGGTVYVTDSATGVLHRIRPDGSLEQAGQVENPNGIQVHGGTILVTGGSDQIFRLDDDGASTPEYETPAGGLDGLVLLDDGRVLVSSWTGSAVYQIDADGQVSELFSDINAPADIGFDTKRNLVLIPHFEDDRVEARPLPSTQTPPLTETLTPTPTAMPFELSRDVPYITDGHPKQKLDIYLPASGDGPFPTLFLIHGGGGDKRDLDHWARHFVEQGYAAVSINYRDINQFDYPVPVQDAFCALAWTHAKADTYGFDPRRIVALGHSAGGTLTAMLGAVDDPDLFTQACPHQLPEADWIQGAILFTGIFDYARALQFSPERRSRLEDYLGGDLDQAAETWAEASATTWVDGSEPPFLLIHGLDDSTIEPEQSMYLAETLERAGVDVELLLLPDASHGAIINSEQSFEAVENFLATLAQASTPTEIGGSPDPRVAERESPPFSTVVRTIHPKQENSDKTKNLYPIHLTGRALGNNGLQLAGGLPGLAGYVPQPVKRGRLHGGRVEWRGRLSRQKGRRSVGAQKPTFAGWEAYCGVRVDIGT
jgi:acetyl esterase/lipase